MTRTEICRKASHVFVANLKKTFEERFWKRVNKHGENGCWIFKGSGPDGYGEVKKIGKTWLAHRLVYTMLVGPIPKGRFVCHHCDNRKCVNPDHLYTGTNQENILDSVKKGRWTSAKLEPKQVYQVRKAKSFQKHIANRYGISQAEVSRIRSRKTWKHLP